MPFMLLVLHRVILFKPLESGLSGNFFTVIISKIKSEREDFKETLASAVHLCLFYVGL